MDKHIIQLTTVHPCYDNRIYEKIVLGLLWHGWEITYIAKGATTLEAAKSLNRVDLPLKNGVFGRLWRNFYAFILCLRCNVKIIQFHDPEFLPFALLLRLIGRYVVYDVHENNLLSIMQKSYGNRYIRYGLSCLLFIFELIGSKFLTLTLAEKIYKKRFPKGIEILNYYQSRLQNGTEISEEVIRMVSRSNSAPRILYTGTITEDRGVFNHIKLLGFLKHHHLYLIGSCNLKLKDKIQQLSLDYPGRVHIVSHEEGVKFSVIQDFYNL